MAKVWKARDAVVKIGTAYTATSGTALHTTMTGGSAIEGNLKSVTIVEPEGAVDKIDLLGEDSNGFQNAELEDKPFSLAKISGTLVHPGDEVLETFAYGVGTAVGATGYTRYQVGAGARPTNVGILVNLDDGTDAVNVAMLNLRFTKIGDRSIGGADGHFEQQFEATCLPKDFYVEFKN